LANERSAAARADSRQILLALFGLHVVGALWRRFVLRDVMARIIWPPA